MIDNINHIQQTEIESIKERTIADNTFMKAPNGEDTKLSEDQWLQVRTKAFKEWFGEWELDEKGETSPNASKVVDKNGEPMVLYHGTGCGFNEFDIERLSKNSGDKGMRGAGFYFSPNPKMASMYGYINMSLFLNIKNPLKMDFGKSFYENLDIFNTPALREITMLESDKTLGEFIDSYLDIFNKIENGELVPSDTLKQIYGESAKSELILDELQKQNLAMAGVFGDADSRVFMSSIIGSENFTEAIKKEGYDGVYDINERISEIVSFSPNQIKSATDNTGEFSKDSDDIRFRFIGEKGAINLDKAEEATHRLDNLNVARKMEKAKKDERSIKIATGWERGADSKWRYEVSDYLLDPKRIQNASKKRYKQKEADAKKKRKELSDVPKAKRFDESFDNLFNEYIQLNNDKDSCFSAYQIQRLLNGEITFFEASLNCIVPNSDLLETYPELSNIRVLLHKKNNEDVYGFYSNTDRIISLNIKDINQLNNGLNHEIQHTIQNIEGFAKGGSSKMFSIDTSSNHLIIILEKIELIMRIDELPAKNALDFLKEGLDEYFCDNELVAIRDIMEKRSSYLNLVTSQDDRVSKALELLKQKADTPFSKYLRLSGEVEARNVEARLGMTAQERRESLAKKTEDVAQKDQIILENDLGLNMSYNMKKRRCSLHSIEQFINDFSKKMGVVVEKVESRDHLPTHIQKRMNNKGRYPGMYDPKTDKVYVILNEILNKADAKATILHETLGHKGLRVLEGKAFEKFLDDVCKSMPSNKREEYFQRFDNDKLLATEEYLAEFAEGYKNPSAWEKVKAICNRFLREIGINLKMSDGDLMYIFKRAQKKLITSYSKENTSKVGAITPSKTTTGKNVFFATFGVIFSPEIYTKMVAPLIKASGGVWNKKYRAVLFSKITSAESFKRSLSEKIYNKEIPILYWKKEKTMPSPTTKSYKI